MGITQLLLDKGEGEFHQEASCPNCQTVTRSTANNTTYSCKNKNCRVILFQVIDDD